MPTFLFWNTGRRPLVKLVADAARLFRVDILILAECSISGADLLTALNRTSADYQLTFSASDSIRVLTRLHAEFLSPAAESDRYSIRRLRLPGQQELLLAIAHLPSGRFFSSESRSLVCIELARLVVEEEQKAGHDRTIVVGDLNLNPFDLGVVAANGLHGVMTRKLAARGSRIVQRKKFPIFYNPMWRFFGENAGGPSGTYYYERAEHVVYFWNIFDQILVRPTLIDCFEDDDLQIIDAVGQVKLTRADGRPNSNVGSDHLPILFEMDIPLEDANAERTAGTVAR
jgi:endonuclease/exonuclease/phosphatase family metal-dependent hydrolase